MFSYNVYLCEKLVCFQSSPVSSVVLPLCTLDLSTFSSVSQAFCLSNINA